MGSTDLLDEADGRTHVLQDLLAPIVEYCNALIGEGRVLVFEEVRTSRLRIQAGSRAEVKQIMWSVVTGRRTRVSTQRELLSITRAAEGVSGAGLP